MLVPGEKSSAGARGWGAVTLAEQYRIAVAASSADLPGTELLPERLALAAAAVLPVDGAGISLFFASDRRLPLGASDPASAEAERLQFTAGEGPCLSSHAEAVPIVADEATLQARWPAFYDALVDRTPIRGTISLPLREGLRGIGALDLYVVPPHDVAELSLRDALTVSAEITATFSAEVGADSRSGDGPRWLDAPAAERRAVVWQAIGFLNSGLGVTSADALALLRAHAYADGRDLDDLARSVTDREVPVEAFR
jgi:hypothetical protein